MTMVDTEMVEAWQNVTKGRVVLLRMSANGQLRDELLGSGRIAHLSSQERRLNQEKAASEKQDVFLNGTLQPVRPVSVGVEDSERLNQNPNHFTDAEALALFKAHHKTFDKRLGEITNASTLERLLEVSQREDVDAHVRQVQALEARLSEINPDPLEAPPEVGTPMGPPDAMKAVTPR